MYLGLKTGWNFGASLFGSILGFAILKPLSKALPPMFGGGYFGPKENVVCQSAATSAGSLGLLFASGFPAAYQLGLLSAKPADDIGRLITFTLCCAYFGIFFTMPLRRLYVCKLKLKFPSGIAAAFTIRSLHVGKNAAAMARKKTFVLIYTFCAAITLRVVSEYAPGILWDWHWSWWFYQGGWHWAACIESWGWIFELTPAFIGVGLIIPLNSAASFAGGAFLAWAIMGPALIVTGRAVGTVFSAAAPEYVNYSNMILDDPVNAPSPKYWFIWPGCMVLLCASLAEISANWRSLLASFYMMVQPILDKIRPRKHREINPDDVIWDPAPIDEQVPLWLWGGGVLTSTVLTMIIMKVQFGINPGVTLLSIIFAFIFSLIGAECAGRVSIIPVTTLGNFSQLIFGGISKGSGLSPMENQLNNGLTGMLAEAASYQCADMLSDLKTTHLIGASPRAQLYAQLVGALVSIFLSCGMYVVFTSAYPCINNLTSTTCSFPAPDVGAWRAVSVAVSAGTLPIPLSSGITAIVFGVFVIVQTFVKYKFTPQKYHDWFPNWNAIGVAFILGPINTYPMACLFGCIVATVWKKKSPAGFAMYGYAIAAGGIAGEGLGGVVNAILQIAGVSGAYKGTAAGCPLGVYCG
ncbi:OPT oligopeptide transporter [Calocera viscosa TUFC12733]|uniref:OPT oligopeptide transporter n=1 Tax=Calocera viscosa (strain TUFC12733) TaxID=1330018 RepID=A0A167NUW5_CALVF|nr:OPT oligopeptide transporter [Calocera viscosa TUFC12733]